MSTSNDRNHCAGALWQQVESLILSKDVTRRYRYHQSGTHCAPAMVPASTSPDSGMCGQNHAYAQMHCFTNTLHAPVPLSVWRLALAVSASPSERNKPGCSMRPPPRWLRSRTQGGHSAEANHACLVVLSPSPKLELHSGASDNETGLAPQGGTEQHPVH